MKTPNFKKFSILLLSLFLTAAVYAQRIDFGKTRLTKREAFDRIEQQTDLTVSYSSSIFDADKSIQLPSVNVGIDEALSIIVSGTGFRYSQQGTYIMLQPAKEDKPARPVAAVKPLTSDVYSRTDSENLSTGRGRKPKTLPVAPAIHIAEETEIVKDSLISGNTNDYTSYYFPTSGYRIEKRPAWMLKTNILYGAGTLTPNLALEMGLGPQTSLEISGSYHPWKREGSLESNKKLVHMILRPEFRWWTCERFTGHFFGVHAFYGHYNIGTYDIPLLFDKAYRYEGRVYGGGITYGYHLMLNKRWALEFNVGLGAAYLKYDKYDCAACERSGVSANKTYFGPTRAGITLVFNIK